MKDADDVKPVSFMEAVRKGEVDLKLCQFYQSESKRIGLKTAVDTMRLTLKGVILRI